MNLETIITHYRNCLVLLSKGDYSF